jgi:exopolyphosphatase
MRRKAKTSILLFLGPASLSFFTFCFLYYYRFTYTTVHPTSGDRSYPFGVELAASLGGMAATFSLATSLADKKKALLARLSQPVDDSAPFIVIMGNEAGDTDSLASSILLSHLLSQSSDNAHSSKFPKSTTFVPLSQLRREDLKLRSENEMLLAISHLNLSDLLFLDDLPPFDKLLRSDICFGLTDHPQLSNYWQPYEEFARKVDIVVDHHADDGAHKDAKLRIMKGPNKGAVGSAVSVVIDLFKEEKGVRQLHLAMANLGLAAILIDTDDVSMLRTTCPPASKISTDFDGI